MKVSRRVSYVMLIDGRINDFKSFELIGELGFARAPSNTGSSTEVHDIGERIAGFIKNVTAQPEHSFSFEMIEF